MFAIHDGLLALGLIAGLAFTTWLTSLWRRDVSIIDGMWPVFIAGAGILYAWTASQPGAASTISPASVAALVLLVVWAARLSLHITIRNHGQPEDRRYQKIRANNQPHFELKSLYLVFGLQAVLAWIVALPFMAIVQSTGETGVMGIVALLLAAFGIAVESIADWQLERFKKRSDSKGAVLDSGLWRYSRHPNYFGECCAWWGFGLMAMSASTWWAVASPLLMTVLLLKVSGVTLLEKDIGERRPEYARYIRETNAFLPGWPRRRATTPAR
jgi:steroid 5-alpha reductase family enzyme